MENFWLDRIMELQSLAQAGLWYGKDKFDIERYQRIRDISAEMLACLSDTPIDTVKRDFCCEYGYQTPKLDTRAAIFEDDRILLVHESSGKWSRPGGWCDIGCSPADNTVKEVREEAGLSVEVTGVIAVQDRDKHNEPRYPYAVTKIFYLCTSHGGSFVENTETTESAYFDLADLPPLATEKCNAEQIEMCFEAYHSDNWKTQFD